MTYHVARRAGFALILPLLAACSPSWDPGDGERGADGGAPADDSGAPSRDSAPTPADAKAEARTDAAPSRPSDNPSDAQVDAGPPSTSDGDAGPVADAGVPPATPPATVPPTTVPPTTVPPVTPVEPPTPTMAELCSVCDANATCTVSSGQASCKCNAQYEGDGKHCSFDSDCSTLSCGANTTCVAIESSHTLACNCQKGYSTALLSQACEDTNECTLGTDDCASKPSTPYCVNSVGSFTCECTPLDKAPNIIANPGFDGTLAPWGSRRGEGSVVLDAGRAKVVTPAAPTSARIYNEVIQTVTVVPSATYKLSVTGTNTANADACAIGARALPWAGVEVGVSGFGGGANGLLETQILVPAGTSSMDIFVGCWSGNDGGEADIWVDNFRMVQTMGTGLCQ